MTGGYTAAVLLISINEKWLQTRWATSRQIKSHHHGLNNVTSTVIKLEAKRYAHMYTMERPVRKLMASLQGSSLEKSDESNYKDRIFNREPCPQERKTICTNRRQLKVFSFPPTGKYIITVKLTRQNLSYKTTTVGFFQGHTGKLSCTEPLTTYKHIVNTHTCQSTSTHLSNKI